MLKLYENIKKRRIELKMSQQDLADKVGYTSKSMISRIEKGLVDLPTGKVNDFAVALRTTPEKLLGSWIDDDKGYYLDPEVARMAQEAYDDPDMRLLLSASRDLSKEDLQYVLDLVKRLKGGEL